ncbi:MarR family transcriptional regulator [Clostridium sp. CF011]|uniref:MarR family winged helix-turn-helix transcriptional regulator n=1 Tax=unclassified Clostridium TaxID=2614128 RepID=UPI001C0C7913|nr:MULTISPECIES: MarR family transcriptional regulator [unclassified Clostridium]MBU3090746.1 MarR family transcriptional regulator [Clostridium sp. CF011]MBW9144689.1 MarR family transcriptional regulator [Clostridium sp. CM027]UVE40560.1 MarR family transcriptional regulator [Clostridium sp. CM027]WAG69522.1 MarR family transcriptional regulator [Clostridium sp. CF011]
MDHYYIQQIFSTIFYLSNKIQVQGDKVDVRITMRQWMVLMTILHLPENQASYNQIANKMGCSKQNVKHLIVNLEKNNYVFLEKSETDKRAVNIKITKNCIEFMNDYYKKGNGFMNMVFEDFDKEELKTLWMLLKKMATYDGCNWTGYEQKVTIKEK